jgi:hypothetical protein
MTVRSLALRALWRLLAVMALLAGHASAHNLPISYLHLQADQDYVHLELIFNVFELTFVSEVDDNKNGELEPNELKAHGQALANHVISALKLSVADKPITAETAGMDPEMTGHHVRLRAHYKVDARRQPLTVESDLNAITSSSHLIQVTYSSEGRAQLAQLDAQSRRVTFQPDPPAVTQPTRGKAFKTGATSPVVIVAILLLIAFFTVVFLLRTRRPPHAKQ